VEAVKIVVIEQEAVELLHLAKVKEEQQKAAVRIWAN
jgi:hypothetical protein